VLPALDAVLEASAKVTQALRRIGRTEEEARNAVQASQMARRVEMPGGLKVPQVVDELFKARPQLREDVLAIWQKGLPATAVAGPKRFAYMEVDLARFLARYGGQANLPDDAIKGFAHLQGRLFKTSEDSASRWVDCEKLFGGLDTPAKKNALKESLVAYRQAVELNAEAPFLIKNITSISPNAYRYSSFAPQGGWADFPGSFPSNPNGWYATFDKFDNKYIATDRLLLPLQTSAPLYRYEFATNALTDTASRIARGDGGRATFLEPMTRDIPANFVGGGTSVTGNASQFIIVDEFPVLRVVDMNTGLQVWPN
jgi:hypothetical protein